MTDQEVSVEASDDGEGFPSHSTSTGVGLRSMAERAEELGGSFTAANDARGAVVRAVFPRGTPAERFIFPRLSPAVPGCHIPAPIQDQGLMPSGRRCRDSRRIGLGPTPKDQGARQGGT
ncbi:hypothetical protein [Kitasatospora acidiphila]|uniref:hypothetical protein n=1 Tax=Kitasatospora acidiphila TaxID=2567942 RepID=UPI0015F0FBC2|nr:hypothetical protein [Kitasatospora acidiphila]